MTPGQRMREPLVVAPQQLRTLADPDAFSRASCCRSFWRPAAVLAAGIPDEVHYPSRATSVAFRLARDRHRPSHTERPRPM